jgi:hypothetical protein
MKLKGAAIAGVLILAVFGVYAAMDVGDSASGHGTWIVGNDSNGNSVRRQFSFSANRFDDGTVVGNAVLRNPAFPGSNGQAYMLKVDISCMVVAGNIAKFGGTAKRSNDPNLTDTVFFAVQDNGEPGAGSDLISGVVFWDADPTTSPGDPGLCGTFVPPGMSPIDAGNIQVRGATP